MVDSVPHTLPKFEGMMKFMPFLFVIASFQIWSQSHVDWSVQYSEACKVLTVSAEIEDGWHIYSQYQNEDEGPIPTQIIVEINNLKIDVASEPAPLKSFDKNYGGEVLYFENSVDFRVALPIDSSGEAIVKVVFMTCNEEGCLPPELKEFKLSL